MREWGAPARVGKRIGCGLVRLLPVFALGWIELLVPFAREANPVALACGVVAVYFAAAIQITSLFKSRLPERLWRYIRRTAFAVFALATVHTFTAGSDADGPLVRCSAAVVGAAFVVQVVYRLVAGRRAHRAATHPSRFRCRFRSAASNPGRSCEASRFPPAHRRRRPAGDSRRSLHGLRGSR